MKRSFTAYIEYDKESRAYVGSVPGISGAHTQAETRDELQKRLVEVVSLCIEVMDEDDKRFLPEFAGITQIEIDV